LLKLFIRLSSSGFNLSILLLLFFCFKISLKTAVNSICLGTYSSCFFAPIATC
jgi:hypothetical protein